MKKNEMQEVNTQISLTSVESKAMHKIQKDYNLCIPSLALHLLCAISKKTNDNKKFLCRISAGSCFTWIIARKALSIYRPFEINNKDLISVKVFGSLDLSYGEIKERLHNIGILSAGRLLLAITRTLIEYPVEAIKVKIMGVHPKIYISPYENERYANKPFNGCYPIDTESNEKLNMIASEINSSKCGIVSNALKMLCDIEFNNEYHIENSNVLRERILQYTGTINNGNILKKKSVGVRIRDIRYSVQILALIEKYGIPGKTELILRIVKFIIDSHDGQILLTKIHENDDSDYNETRMIRNEFRKEVMYAATR